MTKELHFVYFFLADITVLRIYFFIDLQEHREFRMHGNFYNYMNKNMHSKNENQERKIKRTKIKALYIN
jgi:hypothetical protein